MRSDRCAGGPFRAHQTRAMILRGAESSRTDRALRPAAPRRGHNALVVFGVAKRLSTFAPCFTSTFAPHLTTPLPARNARCSCAPCWNAVQTTWHAKNLSCVYLQPENQVRNAVHEAIRSLISCSFDIVTPYLHPHGRPTRPLRYTQLKVFAFRSKSNAKDPPSGARWRTQQGAAQSGGLDARAELDQTASRGSASARWWGSARTPNWTRPRSRGSAPAR